MELHLSEVAQIINPPKNPMEFFKKIISEISIDNKLITMNLATANKEFGVLNRSVVYRGLTTDENNDENITFVTENISQKYYDIKENSKVAITFLYFINSECGKSKTYQIRFNGIAEELSPDKISKFWQQENVNTKIRTKICECGKPGDWNALKAAHDKLLEDYCNGVEKLEQTKTYTAFNIIPSLVDFYYSEPNHIADRIVYRRNFDTKQWKLNHVNA